MKKILLAALCAIVTIPSLSQLLTPAQVTTALTEARDSADLQTRSARRLVSEFTFRTLVRNDFAKLQTGDENKTKVGRYASLQVDAEEQTFNITPIAYSPGNDAIRSRFRTVHSLDIAGKVNSKKIFNFDDRKKVSVGYSFTRIGSGYKFFPATSPQTRRKPGQAIYQRVHGTVYNSLLNTYLMTAYTNTGAGGTFIDSLTNAGDFTSERGLQRKYFEKVKELEEKLTSGLWNKKSFWWFKGTVTPISYDVFEIVDRSDSASFTKPISKEIYNPSAQGSFSYYAIWRRGGAIYLNVWLKVGIKHSLSEVSTTTEWKKISTLGDSSFLVDDTKNLYVLPASETKTKALPDYGFEAIYFFPQNKVLGKFTPGINVQYSWLGIVSPQADDETGKVRTYSFGLIIPLVDKEGKSTINIIPFFERKKFIEYTKAGKDIYGIKFSLPFSSLTTD